ncbi:SMI1/KNR4 family protein [Peribacillus frigoritolerans]|uniref:SMI1/KNR4 family protein n=1 Tax=Peribacillus frigoritolerans TaxID=450367 RepID=UPI0034E0C2F7
MGSIPLTDEIVKKAEEIFKIKLPNSYLSILKQQNGGQICTNLNYESYLLKQKE